MVTEVPARAIHTFAGTCCNVPAAISVITARPLNLTGSSVVLHD